MKSSVLFLACMLTVGCSTTRNPARVLQEADMVLGRERDVRKFEDRLDKLGAQIEKGQTPDERVATVALPGKPGYFPPRTLRVVYDVTDQGLVVVKVAEMISLGSRFTRARPNKAPEPTTMAVTTRAPSSTARASHGRGSS